MNHLLRHYAIPPPNYAIPPPNYLIPPPNYAIPPPKQPPNYTIPPPKPKPMDNFSVLLYSVYGCHKFVYKGPASRLTTVKDLLKDWVTELDLNKEKYYHNFNVLLLLTSNYFLNFSPHLKWSVYNEEEDFEPSQVIGFIGGHAYWLQTILYVIPI